MNKWQVRLKMVAAALVVIAAAHEVRGEPGAALTPRKVLAKANVSAASLERIAYTGEIHGTGSLAGKVPTIRGTVVAERGVTPARTKIAVEGTVETEGTSTPFAFATDGQTAYSVRHDEQMIYKGWILPNTVFEVRSLFPSKYLESAPYSAEMREPRATYLGRNEVAGVLCHVVAIHGGGAAPSTSRYFFGCDDFLLRRVENERTLSGATGSVVFTVASLEADTAIEEGAFVLASPEGFVTKHIPSPEGVQVGMVAPAGWELKSLDGKAVSLEKLRGKVVVLDFWASWCGPCRRAMPMFQRLHKKYKDKPVAIVGVNCRERRGNQRAIDTVKGNQYTYTQLLDGDEVANQYRIRGLPTIVAIGPDGTVLHTQRGFNPAEEAALSRLIDRHMVQQSARK